MKKKGIFPTSNTDSRISKFHEGLDGGGGGGGGFVFNIH